MKHSALSSLVLTAAALTAVLAALLFQAMPATEAVRLRNSFLAERATRDQLEWTPAEVPTDFKSEAGSVPPEMAHFVNGLPAGTDRVEQAADLVAVLLAKGDRGEPIQRSTLDTFRHITQKGGGYCADYTQIFNGLAYAARMPVREWGMSFDGFGGEGHAFNEIYDAALRQWVMVDVFYGFIPEDQSTGRPLSALEFRDRLADDDVLSEVRIRHVVPGAGGFRDDGDLINYYRRGLHGYFLWWGNDVLSEDADPLTGWLEERSRAAAQLLDILRGRYPKLHVLGTPQNHRAVEALRYARNAVLALAAAAGLLVVALALQLAGFLAHRGRRPS